MTSTPSIRIRLLAPADHAAVARLTVAAYRADGQLAAGDGWYERELADVAGRAAVGELLVAVASERSSEASDAAGSAASERSSEASDAAGSTDPVTGEVLGAVLLVLPGSAYAELAGPGEAEFRMLAVDPAAQGRGVGTALVRACLARATELGCRRVRIYTRDFSKAAHRLYERLGFVRTPDQDWTPQPGIHLLARCLELAPRTA